MWSIRNDAQGLGHAGSMREPDDVAAPPPLEQRLEQPHQVLGLLLDLDVAVAQDAEVAAALDLEAGEQEVGEARDQLLEPDEARLLAGQADEALELARQQDEPDQRLGLAAVELEHDADALVGDERERVRRVDRDRRQHRERLVEEALAAASSISSSRQLGHVEHLDALRRAAGRSARASSAAGRAVTAATRWLIAASCSRGVMPSGAQRR